MVGSARADSNPVISADAVVKGGQEIILNTHGGQVGWSVLSEETQGGPNEVVDVGMVETPNAKIFDETGIQVRSARAGPNLVAGSSGVGAGGHGTPSPRRTRSRSRGPVRDLARTTSAGPVIDTSAKTMTHGYHGAGALGDHDRQSENNEDDMEVVKAGSEICPRGLQAIVLASSPLPSTNRLN